MKFTASIVVILAVAVIGSNSSIIPLGALGPTLISSAHSPIAIGSPLALHLAAHPAQIITSIQSAPSVSHAAIIAPAIIAAPHEATSISKTRGAVHVAPLPGHVQSVAQLNLQPAPGTL